MRACTRVQAHVNEQLKLPHHNCTCTCLGKAYDRSCGHVRIAHTCLYAHARAGVVVKYALDGSADPLAQGQSPATAGFDSHMAFATYLASHCLSIDVWDGDSLLQVR